MNITIVGGGFGGVKTALELAKHKDNHITLITDKPDFQYYPALYGTATGRSHLQSWVPLGEIFADIQNIRVHIDVITAIDPSKKMVRGGSGKEYEYKTLVLALGSVTTYFGIEGLDTYAYGIKSADEIKKLKHHLAVEMGEHRTMDKDYMIVGAGPTGVELAAALGSYLERLRIHYQLPRKKINIHLIEAASRVLPSMSLHSSRLVEKRLKKLGVRVEANKKVESATANTLTINGKPIKSTTVIWTSGVASHPFYKANSSHFSFAKNGKIIVDEYMMAMKHVYVIGDNASTPFSGLAQTALHDALFVSANLIRMQSHKNLKKYSVVCPPVVVPVGENWAVFEWRWLKLAGWPASIIRTFADMIGYSDILPFGQALGVWRAEKTKEDDYFPPSSSEAREA